MKATIQKHTLKFLKPAGTSRGTYTQKDSWFIYLSHNGKTGTGECSLLRDLSIDDRPDFENKLVEVCEQINAETYNFNQTLNEFPAIQFGLESALLDLQNDGRHLIYPSEFTNGIKGIPTNGLIWMGSKTSIRKQISEKLDKGFSCIKLKIGALNWETEQEIVSQMRKQFSADELTIRVDANGAFTFQEAPKILSELAQLDVHSIEQPIKAGQINEMANLCNTSPIPIALDEELIGIYPYKMKKKLVETIHPHYLILKPSLLGGFKAAEEWIDISNKQNIDWWATSALESNIGLNAIAQWVYTKNVNIPQGLGTGMLFSNNIDSPLTLKGEKLFYDVNKKWDSLYNQKNEKA